MLLEVKPDLQQSDEDRRELDLKNIFRDKEKFVVGVDSPLLKLNKDSGRNGNAFKMKNENEENYSSDEEEEKKTPQKQKKTRSMTKNGENVVK